MSKKDQKQSKKKSESWACEHGCPSNKICKHLEKLLPNVKRAYKEYNYANIQNFEGAVTNHDKEEQELAFRVLLHNYGLEEIRVDVLVLRFVYNMPFPIIAEFLNIPSRSQAFKIYARGLQLLRERGFRLEDVNG